MVCRLREDGVRHASRQAMKPETEALKARTKKFALDVLDYVDTLPVKRYGGENRLSTRRRRNLGRGKLSGIMPRPLGRGICREGWSRPRGKRRVTPLARDMCRKKTGGIYFPPAAPFGSRRVDRDFRLIVYYRKKTPFAATEVKKSTPAEF